MNHTIDDAAKTTASPTTETTSKIIIQEMVDALTPLQKSVLKWLRTGHMSYGSISREAHETIATGVNQLAMALYGVDSIEKLIKHPEFTGPFSGSGEGGESSERDGTIKQSGSRQIASGRFGVNIRYLQTYQLAYKGGQGAKPAKGGQLDGKKVTIEVAVTRGVEPGTTLVSPPPHHDVYSIEDLKQIIRDLRSANPEAHISVKLVAGEGIGVIAAGVAKCGADEIIIAASGGTGSTPISAKHEFVTAWEQGIAEAHQTLTEQGLRGSVTLIASGGFQTGADDIAKAIALGANGIEAGTIALVSQGCVKVDQCHTGLCPTGIATTQQKIIDEHFSGKPEDIARVLVELAKSTAGTFEQYGFTDIQQAVGRTDLLFVKDNVPITGLETLLRQPINPYPTQRPIPKDPGSSSAEEAVVRRMETNPGEPIDVLASNTIRSFGARIAYHQWLRQKMGLPICPTTIRFNGQGSPGQSFGFLAPKNLTLIAKHTNDGTGKSLEGGTILAETMGNQTGYGATDGRLFARFMGDRAGVRNSGAKMIAEYFGHSPANFMTGGSLTILGNPSHYPTLSIPDSIPPVLGREDVVGPNLGASFTGGVVYLPKKLYAELEANHYLSDSFKKIAPQSPTFEEAIALQQHLRDFSAEINSPLATFLCTSAPELLQTQFFKFIPPRPMQLFAPTPTTEPSPPTTTSVVNTLPDDLSTPAAIKPYTLPDIEKAACGIGFVMNRNGRASRLLVEEALQILFGLKHRGATGIDPSTSDGCGIVFFGVTAFFQQCFPKLALNHGNFGVIHYSKPFSLSPDDPDFNLLEQLLQAQGLAIKDQRQVPINNEVLGFIGRERSRIFSQYIIQKPDELSDADFEKKLIRTRLAFEWNMQQKHGKQSRPHIVSASCYHVIYKGLCEEDQFKHYFPDLKKEPFTAVAAGDHSRFTTSSLTVYENIQPFPAGEANGQINNIRQLENGMKDDPRFADMLHVAAMNFDGYSDTRITTDYTDILHLLGYSSEEITALKIQPYHPSTSIDPLLLQTPYPLEGPNASLQIIGPTITAQRDRNGFRPLRGFISDDKVYLGSELGPIPTTGEILDLAPGGQITLNVQTGSYTIHAVKALKTAATLLDTPPSHTPSTFQFSAEELALRKARAGWTSELDEHVMQGYFAGAKNIVSMSDGAPPEMLVPGSQVNYQNMLKSHFSQIVQPPLAQNEEKCFMSTHVLVGKKLSIFSGDRIDETTKAIVVSSPMLSTQQLIELTQKPDLKTKTLSAIFRMSDHVDGLKTAIEKISAEAVEAVNAGAQLLVLSDLANNDEFAPIPSVILASMVDRALKRRGLRERVSLAVESGSALMGRDLAQLISIGGVDLVHPYLPFATPPGVSAEEHAKKAAVYQEAVRQDFLSIIASLGISTNPAYRGGKNFTALGLDADVAECLGVSSSLGGTNLSKITTLAIAQQQKPKLTGHGRLTDSATPSPRSQLWNPAQTRNVIDASRGKKPFSLVEAGRRKMRFALRDLFGFIPATVFTQKNPLRIGILGGGAAGFYQAKQLLESGIPVHIDIIERNLTNRFGLVGDGIAPDHLGTKNQARILAEVLDDPRVKYYGGIDVGNDVSLTDLKQEYHTLVDCRGASEDVRLGVVGETSPRVLSASQVYQAYNRQIQLDTTPAEVLPMFDHCCREPELHLIGNGNVAADLARLHLKEPDTLEKMPISPTYLNHLREHPVETVRIFARGTPTATKITWPELEELAALSESGVYVTAHFDRSKIKLAQLTPEQKKLFDFFDTLSQKKCRLGSTRALHFHFDHTPAGFEETPDGLKTLFNVGSDNEIRAYRGRAAVTAIGRKPKQTPGIRSSGWMSGEGGALALAEKSAQKTTDAIKQDFQRGLFTVTPPPTETPSWQKKCVIGNQELKNIQAYVRTHGFISTLANFRVARQFNPERLDGHLASTNTAKKLLFPIPPSDPKGVVVCDTAGDKIITIPASEKPLFNELKGTPHETEGSCDGKITCGDCSVLVSAGSKPSLKRREKDVLSANDWNPDTTRLACAHPSKAFQSTVVTPNKPKLTRGFSTTPFGLFAKRSEKAEIQAMQWALTGLRRLVK